MAAQTPMMRQYKEIKARHRNEILFFRLGDFYEMFFDDAVTASRVLGLTLTARGKESGRPIPLAGIPWHKLDHYVDRLLKAGYKVAVCDQTEDPKKAKGLVKRDVTEIATPGTALGSTLETKEANFLVAVRPANLDAGGATRSRKGAAAAGEIVGVAAIDVTTGDFRIGAFADDGWIDELSRLGPAEIVVPDDAGDAAGDPLERALERLDRAPAISRVPEWAFSIEEGDRILRDHFRVETLDGFGARGIEPAVGAAGALFSYLKDLGRTNLAHVDRLARIESGSHLVLDEATRRNLELFRAMREGPRETSLLSVIDRTVTAAGGRLLRDWLLRPLRDRDAITARHEAVENTVRDAGWRTTVREELARFCDIERVVGRFVLGRGTPRDLVALAETLRRVPALRASLEQGGASRLSELVQRLEPMNALADRIERTIVPEPPASIKDGGFVRKGFHRELDELRALGSDVQEWLAKFQEEERAKTGIQTIKVKFNKVFGYYIEVTKARADDVPAEYVRKQTLVNAERYITPALKEQEEKILSAEEKIRALEEEIFYELREEAAAHAAPLRKLARASAEIDVLFAFGDLASARGYCRPAMTRDRRIEIEGGRHPVVETLMGAGEFIPNDTALDTETEQIHLITGPNMAGKSTYLRQVALIQILAQTGSWVPAKRANLGVVDRVFTRVGASDDLARGQSTFLVEMTETANILHNATGESLVLLDEIGRGTSTYDGVSIAWAVVEYLHDHAPVAAKTLFATHYHELSELESRLERVRNFSVRVEERGEEIVFLRRIGPGSIDRSYGIQVARLAGLPAPVVHRALEVLRKLEQDHPQQPVGAPIARERSPQIELFPGEEDTIIEELRALDPNRVTPFDALTKLKDYWDRLRDDEATAHDAATANDAARDNGDADGGDRSEAARAEDESGSKTKEPRS